MYSLITLIGIVGIVLVIVNMERKESDEGRVIASFLLIIIAAFMFPLEYNHQKYKDYDYFINLDHNNIIIDTDHGEHIVISADSNLHEWIINDNI